jgi:hypothetical protein
MSLPLNRSTGFGQSLGFLALGWQCITAILPISKLELWSCAKFRALLAQDPIGSLDYPGGTKPQAIQHFRFNLSQPGHIISILTDSGYRSFEPGQGDCPILLQPSSVFYAEPSCSLADGSIFQPARNPICPESLSCHI